MNTFTAERPKVVIIGAKRADELRPGDRVYFKGTGLVKQVHDAQYQYPGTRVYYDPDTDLEVQHPRDGMRIRWDAPHNSVGWFVASETNLEIAL